MSNRRKSLFEVNHVAQFQLKQQEQSLSNEIDQNIRTLALVHPFSENVRALLVKVIIDVLISINRLNDFHCVSLGCIFESKQAGIPPCHSVFGYNY